MEIKSPPNSNNPFFLKPTTCLHLSFVNHYAVLGVHPSSTEAEIKSAFRRLAKTYHPDVNKGDADAAKQFRTIQSAYETLRDREKRTAYHNRWFGYELPVKPMPPSAETLLRESGQLLEQVASLGPFAVDHLWLSAHLERLSAPDNWATVARKGLSGRFCLRLLDSLPFLPYPFARPILANLRANAGTERLLIEKIGTVETQLRKQHYIEKTKFPVAIAIAIALCLGVILMNR